MKALLESMIFSSAVFLAWMSFTQATLIRDRHDCPGQGNDPNGFWLVDEKEGAKRCILRCNPGYEPSDCHVLRRLDDGWNFPEPYCKKKSLLPKKALIATGIGFGAVATAPLALAAVGFGAAGVVAGSLAAFIQGPVTAAGGWFALSQSAGVLGLAAGTKAAVGGVAGGVTYAASNC